MLLQSLKILPLSQAFCFFNVIIQLLVTRLYNTLHSCPSHIYTLNTAQWRSEEPCWGEIGSKGFPRRYGYTVNGHDNIWSIMCTGYRMNLFTAVIFKVPVKNLQLARFKVNKYKSLHPLWQQWLAINSNKYTYIYMHTNILHTSLHFVKFQFSSVTAL